MLNNLITVNVTIVCKFELFHLQKLRLDQTWNQIRN